MTDKPTPIDDYDPAQALADLEGTSQATVEATEMPKYFVVLMAWTISGILSLATVVPWIVTVALCIPLLLMGVMHFWRTRGKPKPRPILSHSGPYMMYVFLFIGAGTVARFWEPGHWWEAALKWVVLFGVTWIAMSRMRQSSINNRLRDAHERVR